MITKILLDLDGVCNCLIMHALEINGCPVNRHIDAGWPTPGNYDVIKACEAYGIVLDKAEFWKRITREVWATTPASDEFMPLLKAAEAMVGREGVCFLTSPTIDPDCLAGKLEWIYRYAPHWMRRQFLIGPRKHFCATPGSLLIDDSDENVELFREHGGEAVLIKRPWNSGLKSESLSTVLNHVYGADHVSAA